MIEGVPREIIERLPLHKPKQPTLGVWIDHDGAEQSLRSGEDRYSEMARQLIRNGEVVIPPRAELIVAHAELKFVMQMREQNLMDETIVINNDVCVGPLSCDEHLEKFLLPGARLTVIGPSGIPKRFPKPATSTGGSTSDVLD